MKDVDKTEQLISLRGGEGGGERKEKPDEPWSSPPTFVE
jgi:hypothetical protein